MLRYPGTTLAAILPNLHPDHPGFGDPRVRAALFQVLDRDRVVSDAFGGLAVRADGLIPPSSPLFAGSVTPRVKRDLSAAAKALRDVGWVEHKDGWHISESAPDPQTLELLVPTQAADPTLFAVGSQVAADWRALGFAVDVLERDPAVLAADHLRTGDFDLAVVEVAIGHDPDLYPILASSQTRTGGANVVGLQDPALDALLVAARAPGDEAERIKAYAGLQKRLAGGTYLLPIAWPEVVVVTSNRLAGPVVHEVADGSERFGDVLTWRLADDR
jgi:peptide/nickel transport system substrate-binding protein